MKNYTELDTFRDGIFLMSLVDTIATRLTSQITGSNRKKRER